MAWFRAPGNPGGSLKVRTAQGEIASFDTNLAEPLISVKCALPVAQSGSGTPYPSGGGKNKLNYDKWKTSAITRGTAVWENNGVTITASSNDAFTQYLSPYFDAFVAVSEGDSIWLSWEETTNKSGQVMIFTSRSGSWGPRAFVNNSDAKSLHYTVTAEDEGQISFRFGVANSGDTISYKNVQIEKGSEVTPFVPSANIRAISGYTEANITRCGKNLIDISDCIDDYYVRSSDLKVVGIEGASVFYCNVPKNTDLTLTPDKSNRCVILGYYERPSTIENSTGDGLIVDSASGITSRTFNTGDYSFLAIYLNRDSANKPTQIMLNVGSIASTYQSFNGNTYTIAFGQTVYGGVLDVTSGKLTVTHGYVDLGSLTWISAITNVAGKVRMRAALTHKAVPNSVVFNAKCDIYNAITASETYTCVDGISGENTGNYIFVYDSNYSTTADLPAFISMVNGHYLAYELATPFDIDLTPVQISAIIGENNVYSDTNGDTTVQYLDLRSS